MQRQIHKKKKIWRVIHLLVLSVVIISAGILFFIFFLQRNNSSKNIQFFLSMPFREITIPYLREQTYESHLGSLEKISENNQYTSYVTSYTSNGLKING